MIITLRKWLAAGSSSVLFTLLPQLWGAPYSTGCLLHDPFCNLRQRAANKSSFAYTRLSCVSSHNGARKLGAVCEFPNNSTVNALMVPDNHGSPRSPSTRPKLLRRPPGAHVVFSGIATAHDTN